MQNSITPDHRWDSPLISSLSFKGSFSGRSQELFDCDLEVFSNDIVGSDAIYSLPQLPSTVHTREINYKVHVPYILPEMRDVYYKGVFTNSLTMNIHNFNKFDFLYLPFRFAEQFTNAEVGYTEEVCMPFRGHIVRQPGLRHPSEICGRLLLFGQKCPSQIQEKKQKHMCFRTCIFK